MSKVTDGVGFKAGKIKYFIDKWNELTDDQFILEAVNGFNIPFVDNIIPIQTHTPNEINCSSDEKLIIDNKLDGLLKVGVVEQVNPVSGQYLSNIFLRPKKNGGHRLILNLSTLNKFIPYEHFKMENFSSCLSLIESEFYMASVDLQDAYYSVPISFASRKYLRFTWRDVLYEFTCLPNGLACAPRVFTKILKPVFAYLRSIGFISIYYLDDSLLMGKTYIDCVNNLNATCDILSKLGFIINVSKSVLEPGQIMNFLGFTLNSKSMTFAITDEKKHSIVSLISEFKAKRNPTIREFASILGVIVAGIPAVTYGKMRYRSLERNKCIALSSCNGDYEHHIEVHNNSIVELDWWATNVIKSFNTIVKGIPDTIISTDASMKGWGAVCNKVTVGGQWSNDETKFHINVLELKAVLIGLKSLCSTVERKHIRVYIDNMTAVAYVNDMGGMCSLSCDRIAKEIWYWAERNNNWLTAEHIPGSSNCLADKASRVFHKPTEWSLEEFVYDNIVNAFGKPEIDLFASRLNHKEEVYASWKPDPGAKFVNAFSVNWSEYKFYAFPPFSLVGKCLQRIRQEEATGILVAPLWVMQPWFPKMLTLLIDIPMILPLNVLMLPHNRERHPLKSTLRLIACHLSGNNIKSRDFLTKQSTSFPTLGELKQRSSIKHILNNGYIFVKPGMQIPVKIMKMR